MKILTVRRLPVIIVILNGYFLICQSQAISQNIRLKDGDASYRGRLEIKYNGEWGTVCNKNFNNLAAVIICKQLGSHFEYFYNPRPGPSGGRIWQPNVQCNGNERSIFSCKHNGWDDVSTCSHDDDVGISCIITDGAITLNNQPSNTLGVGSVLYYQKEFRTILNYSGWDNNDALVVCRQLGYSTTEYSACLSSTCGPIKCPGGNFPAKFWRNDQFDCNGQEGSLQDCLPRNTWDAVTNCGNTYKAASVKCAVPIQGGWTSWISTSPCSSVCADGTNTRERSCTRPTPVHGGEECIGDFRDIGQCGSNSCVKPIITGASPEQTVISENTAMFYCNATAKPVATIRWLRDGSTLDRPQINVIYSTDGKNCNDDNPNNLCTSYSTLQIFNTQPADSGQYLCNATNDYYNDKRLVNLVVQVAPSITRPPSSQKAEASNNISFICVANAKPWAAIQWIKNGNLLSNTTTMKISSTTMGNCTITDPPDQCVTSSTLTIFNTQPSDSGAYTCNATNEAGYVGKKARLIVVVAPSISTSPSNQIAEVSSNISFICVANAKPPATIQWIKNKNLLSITTAITISSTTMGSCTITDAPDRCVTSSTLRIFNTQPSDDGVYTCNATNEAGYVVGENATLTVIASARPPIDNNLLNNNIRCMEDADCSDHHETITVSKCNKTTGVCNCILPSCHDYNSDTNKCKLKRCHQIVLIDDQVISCKNMGTSSKATSLLLSIFSFTGAANFYLGNNLIGAFQLLAFITLLLLCILRICCCCSLCYGNFDSESCNCRNRGCLGIILCIIELVLLLISLAELAGMITDFIKIAMNGKLDGYGWILDDDSVNLIQEIAISSLEIGN